MSWSKFNSARRKAQFQICSVTSQLKPHLRRKRCSYFRDGLKSETAHPSVLSTNQEFETLATLRANQITIHSRKCGFTPSPNSATDLPLGILYTQTICNRVRKDSQAYPHLECPFRSWSPAGLFPTSVRPCEVHRLCTAIFLCNGAGIFLGLLHHCFIYVYVTHCMRPVEPLSVSYIYCMRTRTIKDNVTQRGRLIRQCQDSLLPVTPLKGSDPSTVP